VSVLLGRRPASLLALLLLMSACATPVGVAPADRQSLYRSLTASVLSTGEPSEGSQHVVNRLGLAERFEDEPEAVLAELRGSGGGLSRDRLFALAELSFAHAEKTRAPEYYLAAAVYAYAFLAPSDPTVTPTVIDPRNRLAADLYNLGLTLGLAAPEGDHVVLEPGERPLPFGRLELTVDAETFRWGAFAFSRFIPVGEFKVRGLRNRYRQAGVGAPLAAELTPVGEGPKAEMARRRIPPRIKVPVSAFVRLENPHEGIESGAVRGRIELYPVDGPSTVTISGRDVPLEQQPTAALAYMLEGSAVWETEYGGFLGADRPIFGDGLAMLQPYRPGRIPVVLVHGTASSPARWAEMLNELQNDPQLRDRVQFWLFTYNTSNPILLSAKQMREALRHTLAELDPDGRDPALRRMVLIGHSQGGLLARLMVTDSGGRFWDNVSRVPLADLRVSTETRELHVLHAAVLRGHRRVHRDAAPGQLPGHRLRARPHPAPRHPADHGGARDWGRGPGESRVVLPPALPGRPDGGGQHEPAVPLRQGAFGHADRGRRAHALDHRRPGRRAAQRPDRRGRALRQRPPGRRRVREDRPHQPLDAGRSRDDRGGAAHPAGTGCGGAAGPALSHGRRDRGGQRGLVQSQVLALRRSGRRSHPRRAGAHRRTRYQAAVRGHGAVRPDGG
jgi:hypothetical protein